MAYPIYGVVVKDEEAEATALKLCPDWEDVQGKPELVEINEDGDAVINAKGVRVKLDGGPEIYLVPTGLDSVDLRVKNGAGEELALELYFGEDGLEIFGVASPSGDNAVANKKYVDYRAALAAGEAVGAAITCGTDSLTAGSSALATGKIYVQYE